MALFNKNLPNNHRLLDAKRKINHQYRGKPVEILSIETGGKPDKFGNSTPFEIPDSDRNIADRIITEITFQQYINLLTNNEKAILKMRLENQTLEEIAKELGYYDASGVKKVLKNDETKNLRRQVHIKDEN